MEILNRKYHKGEYQIVHLPREQWQHQEIPIDYPIRKHGLSAKLYNNSYPETCAWGIIIAKKLIAAIETTTETVFKRLSINILWVNPNYRRQGIGHSLMEVVKEYAKIERMRIIFDVPLKNKNIINFLLNEEFVLIECLCETHQTLEWKIKRKICLTRSDVEIRKERPEDYYEVERMIQKAFWNKFQKGSDDHYLVHKLRQTEEYLPELSRILLKDGKIIGAIFYSRAYVQNGNKRHEILTFGPLGVNIEWRGCGVGELLLHETMKLAAEAGHVGIIILGVPDYYPRVGFRTCDNFGITTEDEKNFDAFMGIELIPNGMKDIHGKFYQSPVFANLPQEEVEEYNKLFPTLKKQYFPMQWI